MKTWAGKYLENMSGKISWKHEWENILKISWKHEWENILKISWKHEWENILKTWVGKYLENVSGKRGGTSKWENIELRRGEVKRYHPNWFEVTRRKRRRRRLINSCYLRIVLHLVNSRTNTFNVRYLWVITQTEYKSPVITGIHQPFSVHLKFYWKPSASDWFLDDISFYLHGFVRTRHKTN